MLFKTDAAVRRNHALAPNDEWYERSFRPKMEEAPMEDKSLTVITSSQSHVLVPKAAVTDLQARLVYSLAGIKDLGEYTKPAAAALSQLALAFDLNPFNQELWVIPIKNKDKQVTGFSLFVGYKGLLRAARRVARDQMKTDFMFGPEEVLSEQEIMERGANRCPACNGSGKYQDTDKQCFKCGGKGAFIGTVVIRVPLYVFSKKGMADTLHIPYTPTYGIGVWQPGDNVAAGRDRIWQASKRARADALRQEFDLPFSYGEDYGETEGEVVETTAIVAPPHPTIEAARIAGVTYEAEDAFIVLVDDLLEKGFDSPGHVMEALIAKGHTSVSENDCLSDISGVGPILLAWLHQDDEKPEMPAPAPQNGNATPPPSGKPATVGTSSWKAAADALAARCPYYCDAKGQPIYRHMLGVAGKCGYEAITDANLSKAIADIEAYANKAANEAAQG